MKKKCILTGQCLTDKNDSKAHIIPSSLGGTIKPKGILSKDANSILNDKIDIPLYNALLPFMALLGGTPDRGNKVKPIKMETDSGDEYFVKFGEQLRPTKPKLVPHEVSEEKVVYKIEARSKKEARDLLSKIKKDHPEYDFPDIDSVVENLKTENRPVKEMLKKETTIGPDIFFPASFVMASIFSKYKGFNEHPEFKSFVDKFDPNIIPSKENIEQNKAIIPPDTFYWAHNDSWLKTPKEVSHVIVFVNDPERKQSLFYVELFNLLGVAVTLPFSGEKEEVYTYGIDITKGTEIDIDINLKALKELEWLASHSWETDTKKLMSIQTKKVERILEFSQRRSMSHEMARLMTEKVKSYGDNHILTEQEEKEIIGVAVEYLSSRIIQNNKP